MAKQNESLSLYHASICKPRPAETEGPAFGWGYFFIFKKSNGTHKARKPSLRFDCMKMGPKKALNKHSRPFYHY